MISKEHINQALNYISRLTLNEKHIKELEKFIEEFKENEKLNQIIDRIHKNIIDYLEFKLYLRIEEIENNTLNNSAFLSEIDFIKRTFSTP